MSLACDATWMPSRAHRDVEADRLLRDVDAAPLAALPRWPAGVARCA